MCKALLCLCARKRDFCGSDVFRRSHFFVWRVPPCGAGSFARGGKGTKPPLGNGSEERLRTAGAPSRLFPRPLFTGEGNFGLLVISGGQNVDRFPLSTRPTGAYCHQNLQAFALYRTPPGACLPVWCGSRRANALQLPSCPGSARLGGVRTAQRFSNF